MREKEVEISKELAELGQRLEKWRKAQVGRRRLPEELWVGAVGVAEREGIYRTAQALHLDYANLKRRIEATTSKQASAKSNQVSKLKRKRRKTKRAKRGTAPAAFVELLTEPLVGPGDCLIEVEGAGGGRLRIQMRMSVAEVHSLVREWRESGGRERQG